MKTYTNPVWPEDAPDPFVLSLAGKFYAYTTETAKHGSGFQVLESQDLVRWTHRGTCFTPPWSRTHLWAPEVIARNGTLWMTYSALNPKTNRHDIAIATATSPTGPFLHRAILVSGENNRVGVIDATIFVEKDGTAFLIYSEEEPRRIVMRRLAPDWLSTVGETIELLRPTEAWEKGVTEAPSVLFRDGKYQLFYSANGFETGKGDSGYCVAHAFATALTGPYTKTGSVLAQAPGRVYGPGHQALIAVDNEDWLVYHGWSDQNEPRYGSNPVGRTLRIDRLTWQDGLPQPVVPTTTPQPAPKLTTMETTTNNAVSERYPAVPLITHDPYFSVWSFSDTLNGDWPRHWTGAVNAIVGMVRIDGVAYRWAGQAPQSVPPIPQTGCQVTPTRSIYTFEGAGVKLTVTFASPLLLDDLDVLSRPASYITAEVISTDGKTHDVALYLDLSGEWVVNNPDQRVHWNRRKVGPLDVLWMGTEEQPILRKTGDNLRIDWGYLQLATEGGKTAMGADTLVRDAFARDGALPTTDDTRMPRPAREDWPVLATAFVGLSAGKQAVSRRWIVAYDDLWSLEYMGQRLRGWWRRKGADGDDLVRMAHNDATKLLARCASFDKKAVADWTALGGAAYARLLTLSYRQAISAHKLAVGVDGQPVFFSKENFSNGCIATVDVTYPSAPLFLRYSPVLLRAMIEPLVAYAESPRWKFPFAPHDLGTYPKANGQVYGGGERDERDQMPVEECGNLLLLAAALARAEGKPEFAQRHVAKLSQWAGYLREKGLDPENQLCTDDFAGHLAHNANLSLKAILAIGAWGQLCAALGRTEESKQCLDSAKSMAAAWIKLADDGDHFKLAFDRPGTWSQKYNLVWDQLLGLNLFPQSVARTEIAFYKRHQNRYGLPLDNRRTYTKLDWIVWTATMTESRADFDALVQPLVTWLDETPSRVPLTDWYETTDGKQVGFQARSVVGGLWLPMLKAHWNHRVK